MEVVSELLGKKYQLSFVMTLPGECRITLTYNDGEIKGEEFAKEIKEVIEKLGNTVTNTEVLNQIVVTYRV